MEDVWEDVKIVDKYPKRSFTAPLEAVAIEDSKQGKPMVELTFGDEVGSVVDISLGTPGEDNSLSSGMALGKFLRSLEALGVRTQFQKVKGRIVDIRFVPGIVGKTVAMVANERTVTSPKGTTTYVDWTVDSVGGEATPKARTEEKGSSPGSAASYEELKGEWKTLLAENLEEGTSYDEGGLVKLLKLWRPDPQQKAALNKVRSRVLKELFAEGFLAGSLSGFKLGG